MATPYYPSNAFATITISRMKKGILLKRLSELSGTASDPGYDGHRHHKPDSSYHIGLATVVSNDGITSSGNKDGNRRDTTAQAVGSLDRIR